MSDLHELVNDALDDALTTYTEKITDDLMRALLGEHDPNDWRIETDQNSTTSLRHRCDALADDFTSIYNVDGISLTGLLAEIRGHECETDDAE